MQPEALPPATHISACIELLVRTFLPPSLQLRRRTCSRESAAGYLCPLSANTYGIDFLSFAIRDMETNEQLFCVSRASETLLSQKPMSTVSTRHPPASVDTLVTTPVRPSPRATCTCSSMDTRGTPADASASVGGERSGHAPHRPGDGAARDGGRGSLNQLRLWHRISAEEEHRHTAAVCCRPSGGGSPNCCPRCCLPPLCCVTPRCITLPLARHAPLVLLLQPHDTPPKLGASAGSRELPHDRAALLSRSANQVV